MADQTDHYDATPGMVMGVLGYVFAGPILWIPAFIMGRRGRRVEAQGGTATNAAAAFWLGLVGIVLTAFFIAQVAASAVVD